MTFSLKKTLSVILAIFMLLSIPATYYDVSSPVASAAERFTQDEYNYEVSDGKATITGVNNSISGDITIPAVLGGYTVTCIGDDAFSSCVSLKSITIPDSVTSIGNWAFYGCSSLERIAIPDSVTSIGYETFRRCTSLRSITIPDSVTDIGEYAFYDCTNLTFIFTDEKNDHFSSDSDGVLFNKEKTEILIYPCGKSNTSYSIPENVTSIGSTAFYSCTSLKQITIPDSVTSIGESAFFGCTSLESIIIPESVTSIGLGAFEDCTSLESIIIPESVTSINKWTFENCKSLTSITIPDSVTSIGESAFFGCTSLESIYIPDSITSIGFGAFQYCTSITDISIPDSVTSIGEWAFFSCESLTSILIDEENDYFSNDSDGVLFNKEKTAILIYPFGKSNASYSIPDNVTSIGKTAFAGCTNLKRVSIPDSVTNIGNYAFDRCANLKIISIPDSVTSIGERALHDCESLTDVYYSGTKQQWEEIDIAKMNDHLFNATIHYGEDLPPEASFDDSEDAKLSGDDVLVDSKLGTEGLLSLAGDGAVIKDKNGNAVSSDHLPATGMTLILADGTEYVIVVPGDADCDGVVSSSDARLTLRASVGLEAYTKSSPEYKAANVESEDTVSSSDARLILRASVGLEDTKAWLR